ncbi:MFS_MosC_like domain containing protein [Candidatus Nanopelagicaceae bacterium]
MENDRLEAREKKLIHILFLCFGFGIMAWIPRFPEVKANLDLENGAFGSLMSTGSIGAFFGLLTVGHIIHKYGALRVTVTSILILFSSLAILVHVHSSLIFLILNITFGFGITAVHVSLNSHSFHFLERSNINLVTTSAGYWSVGSLSTVILSGLLVGRVGLALHINVLSVVLATTMIAIIFSLKDDLLTPNEDTEHDYTVKEIFTGFKIDWPVSLGMAAAIYLEFALADWGTIFTKERLDVSGSLSAAPFIVFTATMIVGRLLIERLLKSAPIDVWVKRAVIFAGTGFGISIIVATHLPAELKWWSYGLFILGFAIAGLGSSFVGPAFFAAAIRRSSLPSAVVVGQFGVVNNVLTFGIKFIVAWIIQFTGSIALAMMIPTAMILATVFFVKSLKEGSKASN